MTGRSATERRHAAIVLLTRNGRSEGAEASIRAVNDHTSLPFSVSVPAGAFDLRSAAEAASWYLVLLAPGTIPLRRGWLRELTDALDDGAAVAGAWDEGDGSWCCIATTVAFAKDHVPRRAVHPAWALVRAGSAAGRRAHRLMRSDHAPLGRLGNVYGDALLELGAGATDPSLGDQAETLVVEHGEELYAWVRGDGLRDRLIFVLGMHRSGTSCLTACLEQCGVSLGSVERHNYGQPHGNLEHHRAFLVNEALLAAAGASWRSPPHRRLPAGSAHAAPVRHVVADLEAAAPSALKDPRLVFTIDEWLAVARRPALVGTFRHPEAVARSLWERERMPPEEAHELWRRYNAELVEFHRARPFPLIEFDLSDRTAYCRAVALLAAELGLPPRIHAISNVVEKGYGRTRVPADAPVPPPCAEVYDYLRRHRHPARRAPGVLAERLVQWFEQADEPEPRSLRQRAEVWAWDAMRHLPGPVRRAAYRAVRRLRVRVAPTGGEPR